MPKRTFEISQLNNNGIVATSAANAMLECIRVVSPETLIVLVSSNCALFGELGQDRCARPHRSVPAYRPLGLKLAGQTIPTLRTTSPTKARGLRFGTARATQSHSIHTRLPRL